MQHLHHKAVILYSYEDFKVLQEYIQNALGIDTFCRALDQNWSDERYFESVIFFEYSDRLYWTWGLDIHSPYSLLPIQAILSPSDYPEYYI